MPYKIEVKAVIKDRKSTLLGIFSLRPQVSTTISRFTSYFKPEPDIIVALTSTSGSTPGAPEYHLVTKMKSSLGTHNQAIGQRIFYDEKKVENYGGFKDHLLRSCQMLGERSMKRLIFPLNYKGFNVLLKLDDLFEFDSFVKIEIDVPRNITYASWESEADKVIGEILQKLCMSEDRVELAYFETSDTAVLNLQR